MGINIFRVLKAKAILIGLTLILALGLSQTLMAQNPRGLFVDDFKYIIGDTLKEDSLLNYAQSKGINYLTIYNLHYIQTHLFDITDPEESQPLSNFISKAKTLYGIIEVGAAGEKSSSFDKVITYNNNQISQDTKFDVLYMEFEFWNTNLACEGGYYCNTYSTCDTASAFQFFIEHLWLTDSIANANDMISETYLGWFNQGQANQIVSSVDRFMLHAYVSNPYHAYNYTKSRLELLAQSSDTVNLSIIFNGRDNFLGDWLNFNLPVKAFDIYMEDFEEDTASWKDNIFINSHQWFAYNEMPKQILAINTPGQIFINEFMADNDNIIQDEYGEYNDWFEIFYDGYWDLDLGSYYLSDTKSDLMKYRIPTGDTSLSISPGDFKLFWADGETSQGGNHVNFSLNKDGDAIFLVAPNGTTIIDSITFDTQVSDAAMARNGNGNPDWRIDECSSPGFSNGIFQTIELNEGWNGVSSNINLFQDSINTICGQHYPHIELMKSLSGIYWPEENINTIIRWSNQTGYEIKCDTAVTLCLRGDHRTDMTIYLEQGWNLIPVPCKSNVSTTQTSILSDLGDTLVIVKNITGDEIFWPEEGIINLFELKPLNTYKVLVLHDCQITFPTDSRHKSANIKSPENNSPWKISHISNKSEQIAIHDIHSIAENGDLIAAFTEDNICAGISVVNEEAASFITLYGDEETNKTKTGFAEGEQINLRLWKKNKGISVDLEAIFKNGETESFYFSETIDKIISFRSPLNTNLTSTKYHGFQIYPNPAIEFFNIEIPEKEKSEKIIEICNTKGSVIHKCNFNQNQISFSTELFPPGIYFIKLYSGKTSFSKKIIIY